MKNQYFGDVNDYHKYGLLRALAGSADVSIAVCWMLTPDDGRTDGRFIEYLAQPEKWRRFDPILFDKLQEAVLVRGERSVGWVERMEFLSSARFYDEALPDDLPGRRRYFDRFWEMARDCKLVFFDPDNGIEVKSRPLGRKDSSKYLYWPELDQVFSTGHSVLVYQHFRRESRETFIARIAQEIRARTGARRIYSFRTVRVVFYLLLPESPAALVERNIPCVEEKWGDQIRVQEHNANPGDFYD